MHSLRSCDVRKHFAATGPIYGICLPRSVGSTTGQLSLTALSRRSDWIARLLRSGHCVGASAAYIATGRSPDVAAQRLSVPFLRTRLDCKTEPQNVSEYFTVLCMRRDVSSDGDFPLKPVLKK